MQLLFSDSPGHVRLGTNTDIKGTNRSPRAVFSQEAEPRITPIAPMEMDRSNKPRMTRIFFCSGSRVGRDRQSTINNQTSNIKHSFHSFTLPKQRERCSAFTLIELLVVIGLMLILMVLVAPAFTTIKSGTDASTAAYTIKGALDTARSYAMANNTYAWVGFFEEDASTASTNPATPGNGRIVISIVASKDGTETYSSISSPAADMDPTGTKLSQVGKLLKINSMHLRTFANGTGTYPYNTFPTRPSIPAVQGKPLTDAQIGDTSPADSLRYFHYPPNVAEASAQYKFRKMIQFNARGECRPQNDNYEMRTVIEVAFQPIRGNAVTLTSVDDTKDCAIQLSGLGGSTKIYQR
jgi:type II secretory pathway pseudopilin PulG